MRQNNISPALVILDYTSLESDRMGENPARNNETFFSWSPCACCGDRNGGNRTECSALIKHVLPDGTHVLHVQDVYDCCDQCVIDWQ